MTLVSGRVTAPTGEGVPGCYVYAVPAGGARFGRAPGTHSDLTGRWALDLPAGQWTVRETGHTAHDVQVRELAIDVSSTAATTPGPTPTRDDLERLLQRRRSRATREDA